MSKHVIVIGGGIIGLCSAYYLHKEGHQVTIVDQSNMDEGASYVNAGYISPSHIIPLSAPGVMKKGLRWMFNTSSPLYIKPRLKPDFLRWVWAFNTSCNTHHVEKAIPVIRDIALLSQELFDAIKKDENFSFHYEKKGLLMLCLTEKMLDHEAHIAGIAREVGLEGIEVSSDTIQKMDPKVKIKTIGGVFYTCDYHTTPNEFMDDMKNYLRRSGVKIVANEKVEDIVTSGNTITEIHTDKQKLTAEEYVLSAGSWSSILSKKLGLKLKLVAGKGYRINTSRPTGITLPAILAEAKVAVTPMHGFTRFGGTMEIAGINKTINKARVEAIANAVSNYYPEVHLTEEEKQMAASGLRPVSHDGLPFIGKSGKCTNLTIATGHAMMGWSMATASGKLVSEIISDKQLSMAIDNFSPDR